MASNEKSSNIVAQNAIWTEHVKKEAKRQTLNTDFNVNPSTMHSISAKPTAVDPWSLWKADDEESDKKPEDDVDEQLHARLRQAELKPREKASFPQTSAQEYGWDIEKLNGSRDKWNRPLTQCDITKYASSYVAAQGKSPFSSKS
eukprot:101620_1